MLPLAFDLTGRSVLVIGAGVIGARKASSLVAAGAKVTVISREVLGDVPDGIANLEIRPYRKGDLKGFFLVISATGNADVNDEIVAEASERSIWLNVVDDLERSSFYFAALHRQGDVVVSVSTSGASPALAQEIRDRVAASLPTDLGEIADTLRAERTAIHAAGESTEDLNWRPRVRELLDRQQPS